MALLTSKETAQFLGFSPLTLKRWRVIGEGPEYFVVGPGNTVRYDESVIEKYLESRKRKKTLGKGRWPSHTDTTEELQ